MKPFLHYLVYQAKLRSKLFLSYGVVGIIPFLIFSAFIITLTNRQLKTSARNNFDSVFYSCSTSLNQKIEQVETAMNILASDSNMGSIINTDYQNSYDKYFYITNYFDSIVNTIVITNPELANMNFYVNSSLAGIRTTFFSFEDFKKSNVYQQIHNTFTVQWFLHDNQFSAYIKIYDPNNPALYAVMEVMIPIDAIIDPQLFENLDFYVTLRNQMISSSTIKNYPPPPRSDAEMAIMGGEGLLQAYMSDRYDTSIEKTSSLLILLGILAAFVLLLFTIHRFADGFAKRIQVINHALSETVQNHFSVTLPENYHDEIGELTIKLNKMIRDTARLIQDVYESRIKEREYEMKALQAQLNPHFLYNTLSAINWHALTTNNTSISEIVTALSRFYRTALNSGNNITTIENEFENIKAYVQIQQNIHNHSFDVTYEVEPAILPYHMPNLILQPIVENAIEHGLDLKTDGRGKLTIHAAEHGEEILLEVIDNGVGISQDKLDRLLKQDSKSYGLRNVNKRLELFYGNQYRLEYYSSCVGTTFQIFLPKLKKKN